MLGYPLRRTPEGGFTFIPQIDFAIIRKHLLYWDVIDWACDDIFLLLSGLFRSQIEREVGQLQPELSAEGIREIADNLMLAALTDSPEFKTLEREGVFRKTLVRRVQSEDLIGDIPKQYQEARIAEFQRRNEESGELWSLSQGVDERLLDTTNTSVTNVIEVQLYDCLPTPGDHVKVEEILEFKRRRTDELIGLRVALDSLYSEIVRSGAQPAVRKRTLAVLSDSVESLHRVIGEAKMQTRVSTFRTLLNTTLDSASVGAGLTAAALVYNVPLPTATALGVGATVIRLLTAEVRKPKEIPEKVRDYAYVRSIFEELDGHADAAQDRGIDA